MLARVAAHVSACAHVSVREEKRREEKRREEKRREEKRREEKRRGEEKRREEKRRGEYTQYPQTYSQHPDASGCLAQETLPTS